MNRVAVVLIAALVVAVAALAASTLQLRSRVSELEARTPVTTQGPLTPGLAARPPRGLDESLADRVAALESRPTASASASASTFGAGAGRPPRADEHDADAAAPSEAATDLAAAPEVRAAVRAELERVEEERGNAREEGQRARLRERLEALAKEANLSDSEKAKVGELLDAEIVEMRQVLRDSRDAMEPWPTLRAAMKSVRAKTDENAKALLDDDAKLAAYEAMRKEERRDRDRSRPD